jgi:hypothetical protein
MSPLLRVSERAVLNNVVDVLNPRFSGTIGHRSCPKSGSAQARHFRQQRPPSKPSKR